MKRSDMMADELLSRLDGSGSDDEWAAVMKLRERGDFPHLLLERFRVSRAWKARSSCVYHAIRYARHDADAIAIGKEAITDKSKVVRYRGCMLLAYSQKKELLPILKHALEGTNDPVGKADLLAAVGAIEHENHNFFVDRKHSGKAKMEIR
jgi:hypothetical protein